MAGLHEGTDHTWLSRMTRIDLLLVAALATHNVALIVREISYPPPMAFPRPLELLYLISFIAMVPLAITAVVMRARLKARLKKQTGMVMEDERSEYILRQAALIALAAVLVAQLPFVIVSVSSKALALITLTIGATVFAGVSAWLDRNV